MIKLKGYKVLFLISIVLIHIAWIPSCLSTINTIQKPNVIIIYLDDLSCYGVNTLKTPNIDALATRGIKFTNGYPSSATCTPSRYALITGVYPCRNKKVKILRGDSPLLIRAQQKTLPKVFSSQGYDIAIIGNWILISAYKGNFIYKNVVIESGRNIEYQLYDLEKDRGQQNNIANHNSE